MQSGLLLEHTFKLMKSQLGWTAARVRHPEQAVRWTWLLIAAYVQLRLARGMAADLRRPWERRPRPGRPLTPCRVRRSFRHLRNQLGTPGPPAENHPPRPRTPARKEERPSPAPPPRIRTSQNRRAQEIGQQEERLNLKPRNGWRNPARSFGPGGPRRVDTVPHARKKSHLRRLRSFQDVPGRRLGERSARCDRCLGGGAPAGRS
jgi:hypothetical protein